MRNRIVVKLMICAGLVFGILSQAKAETVNYDPIKTQVAMDTAQCMYEWMQGSLNRGARDKDLLIGQAVYMCSTIAFKFGYTQPQMTDLATRVFVSIPGVSRK